MGAATEVSCAAMSATSRRHSFFVFWVACLHLPALGAQLMLPTTEQADYIGVSDAGPLKPNTLRHYACGSVSSHSLRFLLVLAVASCDFAVVASCWSTAWVLHREV